MDKQQVSFKLGNDTVTLETGRIGRQAGGAIFATYGDTVVFCSAVASKKPTTMSFFPLMVNYTEKFYAAGKVPGGFIKREGRPKDHEVLISRLIDRPIRPLFPDGFMHEVQVFPTTISVDHVNQPDILAMIAATASLSISNIPFDGPVGAIRIGHIDGEFILNPTHDQMLETELDLIVSGTDDAILMVEGDARNVSEDVFLEGLRQAHEGIKIVVAGIQELVEKAGKEKMDFTPVLPDNSLEDEVRDFAMEKIRNASKNADKLQRQEDIAAVVAETLEHFEQREDSSEDQLKQVESCLHDLEKDVVRTKIVDEGIRPDGRKLDEIRPIDIEVGFLPRTHGSALFTRGQTQAMAVCTLGTESDAQRLDNLEGDSQKHFMLHYNFPPFSVGEVGRVMGASRREIGHGMLAERALTSVLPKEADFPYTVRIVSEIMESNGSSSMASVCGGCLSLMDAGVPIKDVVAGIAMGLIIDKDSEKFRVLTDIQGLEDHLGDMDFKITGTETGITAFQMDIKVKGITFEIIQQALDQAREARLFILDKMKGVIAGPRDEISRYAPKIISLKIDPEKIGAVIGKGGETIRGLQEETGSIINISEDGTINIATPDGEAAEKAKKAILALTTEVEPGDVFTGKVKRVTDFGAFVEFLPGKQGLCHVSKLSRDHVDKVSDIVSEGDSLKVRVVEIDKLGRYNLSAINTD